MNKIIEALAPMTFAGVAWRVAFGMAALFALPWIAILLERGV
jgi:hypothetical protein